MPFFFSNHRINMDKPVFVYRDLGSEKQTASDNLRREVDRKVAHSRPWFCVIAIVETQSPLFTQMV